MLFRSPGLVVRDLGEPDGSPAVMAAVPSNFTIAAGALVVPVEGDVLASGDIDGEGGWLSAYMGDDVRVVNLVTEDRLEAPALVGHPSRRVGLSFGLAGTAETWIGLAIDSDVLDGGVTGDSGKKSGQNGGGAEELGHVDLFENCIFWYG